LINKTRLLVLVISGLCLPTLLLAQSNAASVAAPIGEPQAVATQNLVDQFYASSDLVRPTIARQVQRSLRQLDSNNGDRLVRARGRVVLARQAVFDGRKDQALRDSRAAITLLEGVTAPQVRTIRANATALMGQALWMKEDYVAAARAIAEGLRVYGPAQTSPDYARDELLLWQAITLNKTLLSRQALLEELARRVALANLEPQNWEQPNAPPLNATGGGDTGTCPQLVRQAGEPPIFPVNSMLQGKSGGVLARFDLSADGRPLDLVVTAYTPTQSFAGAVEAALKTWQFGIPADLPERCRRGSVYIFTFSNRK
jgi:hypothetical protein